MIHVEGRDFKDELGRTVMLRGVNVSGSSKLPAGQNGPTWVREGFFDHRDVTFVGRPFPLAEADEHFRRLKRWGLTFLRLLVTWEAIEHKGPGIYDEEYLDYLRALVIKAGEHGLKLFIDPHQDVWSRFSGGDGAPGWTLEAVGFDLQGFEATNAAIVHATHGDPFPRMVWPTNAAKLAAATMFTLFFGGDDFAPKTRIEGEPAQEYLQRHYIQSICKAAERLAGLEAVLGYDTLNEPEPGYIGHGDLNVNGGLIQLDASPTAYQSMLLGEGIPQEVDMWEIRVAWNQRAGKRLLNAERRRAWQEGCSCIWREHGVWDFDANGQPRLLQPEYFSYKNGRKIVFEDDYYLPFAERFADSIRAVDPGAAIFIEGLAPGWPPHWDPKKCGNLVFAPHWYDGLVLFRKDFSPLLAVDALTHRPVWLPWNIEKSFAHQLAHLKRGADDCLGGAPVVLAEFGIPYDMERKRAFQTGDFSKHEAALDRTFRAIEANLLHTTLWNYTPDNTNERGDLWNDEDLSIFSRDQQKNPADPDSGGRALHAFVRPYPRATAGTPLRLKFDMKKRVFEFRFKHDPAVTVPTEFFIPVVQYPNGVQVEASDGRYELRPEEQVLLYWHSSERAEHTIRIRPV